MSEQIGAGVLGPRRPSGEGTACRHPHSTCRCCLGTSGAHAAAGRAAQPRSAEHRDLPILCGPLLGSGAFLTPNFEVQGTEKPSEPPGPETRSPGASCKNRAVGNLGGSVAPGSLRGGAQTPAWQWDPPTGSPESSLPGPWASPRTQAPCRDGAGQLWAHLCPQGTCEGIFM